MKKLIRLLFSSFLLLGFLQAVGQITANNAAAPSLFTEGESQGVLDNPEINEASGIEASIKNKHMLWLHNDSGGEPKVYLVDKHGKYISDILIKGIRNRDWEDICVGPGPIKGKNYLYIAEIGDNLAVFNYKYIYRIVEPELKKGEEKVVTDVDSIKFELPDGRRDTEALFIDQQSKDVYVFSKREEKNNLYVLRYPQPTTEITKATYLLTLPFTQIVAADYQASTGELLVKTYNAIYYWKKRKKESIESMIKREPEKLTYQPEPQGEAICFDAAGKGFYTISEEAKDQKPVLYFYRRIK